MLEIQKYLQYKTIDNLKEELGIKHRRHNKYPNLICFNYDQLESPKLHPIVRESRGIILDEEKNWSIISYPYRRFFNYGESGVDELDWQTTRVYEKLDGSLVVAYNYKEDWHFATRSMPDASGQVNGFYFTFEELIWTVFTEYEDYSTYDLNKNCCYMFELCTPYNRVVVPHKENKLILHGVRNLITLKEENIDNYKDKFNICNTFNLNNWHEVLNAINKLNGLNNEGFILVDNNFNRAKIKSPQYVALSHLKEGLTENKILEIIRHDESEEFLIYFPEYADIYNKYQESYNNLIKDIENKYSLYRNIENQKEFALCVKDLKYAVILFGLRKNNFSSVKHGLCEIKIDNLRGMLEC